MHVIHVSAPSELSLTLKMVNIFQEWHLNKLLLPCNTVVLLKGAWIAGCFQQVGRQKGVEMDSRRKKRSVTWRDGGEQAERHEVKQVES